MKCQHCEKPATFHITELTDGVPEELHLCEEHARIYLMQADVNEEDVPSIAGALAQHLNINEAAEQLAKLDQQACPLCGITFYEFRHVGRLGCPHDYICFEDEIDPIVSNIHSATMHVGKKPRGAAEGTDKRTDIIRLRREMEQAIQVEDYEKASQLRDQIIGIDKEQSG